MSTLNLLGPSACVELNGFVRAVLKKKLEDRAVPDCSRVPHVDLTGPSPKRETTSGCLQNLIISVIHAAGQMQSQKLIAFLQISPETGL